MPNNGYNGNSSYALTTACSWGCWMSLIKKKSVHRRKKTKKEKILEQREKRIAVQEKEQVKGKVKIVMGIFLFFGAWLILKGILIFKETFINWYIPIMICLFIGISTILVTPDSWKEIYKNHFKRHSLLWLILNNCLSFGSIGMFIFMNVNYNSSNESIETHKLEIVRKSSKHGQYGKRIPVADVNYNGLIKTISFRHKEKDKLNASNYISLKIKKGNLGFDIITKKEITE